MKNGAPGWLCLRAFGAVLLVAVVMGVVTESSATATTTPTTSVLIPTPGAALSGTTTLDASAANATSVEFWILGGPYGFSAKLIGTATPTLYGWLSSWDTTTVPDASYALVSEASNSSGTTFSAAVSITVNNPTTSVLIPSTGAALSGTTILDASAANATSVEFWILGGPYGFSAKLIGTATPTLYGWLSSWDTTTVPEASYALVSEAFNASIHTFSAPVSITVSGSLIRAAFFYPWFPEAWNQQGVDPFTHYNPSLGFYSSSDAATISEQIRAMQYGNIQAGIASWWGQGSMTDSRVPLLLQQATGTGFKWALYYEAEGNAVSNEAGSPNPTVAQISSDLAYIKAHYASNPNYLYSNGKPVIFVYGDASDNCSTADRWKQANTMGFYVQMKVFAGYRSCASQPDAWHQYGPAVATDSQAGYSFSISPGFYKANEASPRLARDPAAFNQDVSAMVASHAPWQLITTFNEWGEGSSVESAQEWSSASGFGTYLDVLHAYPDS